MIEIFQFIEFSEFNAEKSSQTALQAAKNKSLTYDKIIDKMSMYNELFKSEYSKKIPQCNTIRDLNVSIESITGGKYPKDLLDVFMDHDKKKMLMESWKIYHDKNIQIYIKFQT